MKGFCSSLEAEVRAFILTTSPRVYDSDSCPRGLVHSAVSGGGHPFSARKPNMRQISGMVDYNVRGDIHCQHSKWAEPMSHKSRLLAVDVLY